MIDNWATDWGAVRKAYDVLVFYNMNMSMDGAPFREPLELAVNELGEAAQGIVMLQHVILAYPDNAVWSRIVGMEQRQFNYYPEQQYVIKPAAGTHPIGAGISPAEMADETYTMMEPGEGSGIVFTCEHGKSMRALGWTRQYKQARVFCFQPGHDGQAWGNPVFREVLARGSWYRINRVWTAWTCHERDAHAGRGSP